MSNSKSPLGVFVIWTKTTSWNAGALKLASPTGSEAVVITLGGASDIAEATWNTVTAPSAASVARLASFHRVIDRVIVRLLMVISLFRSCGEKPRRG
jgi:hypothetical protein